MKSAFMFIFILAMVCSYNTYANECLSVYELPYGMSSVSDAAQKGAYRDASYSFEKVETNKENKTVSSFELTAYYDKVSYDQETKARRSLDKSQYTTAIYKSSPLCTIEKGKRDFTCTDEKQKLSIVFKFDTASSAQKTGWDVYNAELTDKNDGYTIKRKLECFLSFK